MSLVNPTRTTLDSDTPKSGIRAPLPSLGSAVVPRSSSSVPPAPPRSGPRTILPARPLRSEEARAESNPEGELSDRTLHLGTPKRQRETSPTSPVGVPRVGATKGSGVRPITLARSPSAAPPPVAERATAPSAPRAELSAPKTAPSAPRAELSAPKTAPSAPKAAMAAPRTIGAIQQVPAAPPVAFRAAPESPVKAEEPVREIATQASVAPAAPVFGPPPMAPMGRPQVEAGTPPSSRIENTPPSPLATRPLPGSVHPVGEISAIHVGPVMSAATPAVTPAAHTVAPEITQRPTRQPAYTLSNMDRAFALAAVEEDIEPFPRTRIALPSLRDVVLVGMGTFAGIIIGVLVS